MTPGTPDSQYFYIASRADGSGPPLHRVRLDPGGGRLELVGSYSGGATNASFPCVDRARRFLFLADASKEWDGQPGGAAHAYAIEPGTGALRWINGRTATDGSPCYACLTPNERFLMIAGYVSGNLSVFPVGPDGRLGERSDFRSHADPALTAKPHAHSVLPDPTGQFAVSADLGVDRILVYRIDQQSGKLIPHDPPFLSTRTGSGPRHLAWHPSGRFLFAMTEYGSTVIAMRYDGGRGVLSELQVESALPAGFTAKTWGADIQVHPSGRSLYATNRGHESVVAFAIDPATGRLSLLAHTPSGGNFPNACRLDAGGRFLVVVNTKSDRVVSLAVDPATGALRDTGQTLVLPKPTGLCLA
jgi:6-phosphogluconolactonase